DRLVNVYTNDAQVKMDAYPVKSGVTAEVLDVLVKEGDRVQKDQLLVRLVPDDLQAEVRRAEAAAEGIQAQLDELRLELPLALQQARHEVARAQAVLETRQSAHRRAAVLLEVQRDRTDKSGDSPQMLRVHEEDVQRQAAEVNEQQSALEMARTG